MREDLRVNRSGLITQDVLTHPQKRGRERKEMKDRKKVQRGRNSEVANFKIKGE